MVKPKKHLGQHFLTNKRLASRIVGSLTFHKNYQTVLEVGPGKGILTQFLQDIPNLEVHLIEIDHEAVIYLKNEFPGLRQNIVERDFLEANLDAFGKSIGIIGNFPYNISSQIFFKIFDNKEIIQEVVCMVQREVGERVSSPPGSKAYGILSVLLGAFYDISKLFAVKPGSFYPPPKVHSTVIRLARNKTSKLPCDEKLFKSVIKQGFQNRRKTLRNALKPLNLPESLRPWTLLDKRAEQLSVEDYVQVTLKMQEVGTGNKI